VQKSVAVVCVLADGDCSLIKLYSAMILNGMKVRSLERGKSFGSLQKLSRSCGEGLPAGARRAKEGKGPEAGRRRACDFTDALY
jgi:hypothetical protein